MPSLSIIIPTRKRANILKECLRRIERQTVVDELEVIVVSDGHDDATTELAKGHSWNMPVRFLEIEERQQGSARNCGVREAKAPLCLFIGDDMYMEPDACKRHLAAQTKITSTYLVLGFVTWDPAVGITPVMRWLESSGWQFKYPAIERYAGNFVPPHIQHQFTYTNFISLPTNIARRYGFREDITLYGWEDIDWGKRLADDGVRLFYEPGARALHHHHLNLQDSLTRMETLGTSVIDFPHTGRIPRGWKKCAYEVLALLPTMAGKHRKAFLKGMRSRLLS